MILAQLRHYNGERVIVTRSGFARSRGVVAMHLILEFLGGPRDGEVLAEGSRCLQSEEIQQRCTQHESAVIGQRINCATPYGETILETCSDSAIKDFVDQGCRFPNHTYEVLWRRDVGPEVRLGMKHVGIASQGNECRSCPLRELNSGAC
jgi:hypothetical protein